MTFDAYKLHKPIRNNIRKYDRDLLLRILLRLMHHEEGYLPNTQILPWNCLLLMRWILEYGEANSTRIVPNIDVVLRLLSQINILNDKALAMNNGEPHSIAKFFRRIAFQQFPYQIPLQEMNWKAGRQLALLSKIGSIYKIPARFVEETGIELEEFIAITFSIFSLIQNESFTFKITDLSKVFSIEILEKYFSITSFTIPKGIELLKEDTKTKGRHFVLSLYEISPLWKKPFIRVGPNLLCLSKLLFRYFFANFAFQILSDREDRFIEMGPILEKYIRSRLEFLKIDFILDKSWKKILNYSGPASDFTIKCNEGTILIESKRKDLAPHAKVMQSNISMSKNLDDSIVSGIVQMYSLANAIRENLKVTNQELPVFYGLLVSHKENYLGGGQQFWDEFLEVFIEKSLDKNKIPKDLISPKNIFLISVDDFDHIVTFLHRNPQKTLAWLLETVSRLQDNPNTRRMFFSQYLTNLGDSDLTAPEHLLEEMEEIMQDVILRVQKTS